MLLPSYLNIKYTNGTIIKVQYILQCIGTSVENPNKIQCLEIFKTTHVLYRKHDMRVV